eukprot:363215-Chlamydomonas_euryale.AAC.5
MRRVLSVKDERRGEALGRRPERRAGRRRRVLGKREDELRDAVVEEVLEAQARPLDAVLECVAHRLPDQQLSRLLQLLTRRGVRVGADRRCIFLGVGEVCVRLGRRLFQHALKVGARPGQAVVDVVREAVQRAHRCLLLGRVAARAVVLRHAWHDDLRRLAEVHAAAVDVEARVDVVERVDDDVQLAPETVVEHGLSVRGHSVLERVELDARVQLERCGRRARRLGLADVAVAEQELARQIALLDHVVIGHSHASGACRRDAHHRKILEELAPQRARAY